MHGSGARPRIFLRADEDYYRKTGNRPLYLEASIGLKTGGPGTRLDSEEPVEIELPGGKSLLARGRIDRVDQVAGPQAKDFAIWDYKTGGTWKYQQNPRPFWQGRVIQHALYVSLVSARLRELGGDFAGARVGRFGFFFPSGKALRRADRVHAGTARSRGRNARLAGSDRRERLVPGDNRRQGRLRVLRLPPRSAATSRR